jgi:voltage-gated potassium channel
MSHYRRSIERFLAQPASIRNATIAITSLTVAVVMLGAVLIRVFDREEYPTFGEALWFTLQTVTTVGYGDTTPERLIGRIVAAVVMLTAIGLITVVTAAIASLFVEAARAMNTRPDQAGSTDAITRIEGSLTEIADRLDRLESTLAARSSDQDEQDEQDERDGGSGNG